MIWYSKNEDKIRNGSSQRQNFGCFFLCSVFWLSDQKLYGNLVVGNSLLYGFTVGLQNLVL